MGTEFCSDSEWTRASLPLSHIIPCVAAALQDAPFPWCPIKTLGADTARVRVTAAPMIQGRTGQLAPSPRLGAPGSLHLRGPCHSVGAWFTVCGAEVGGEAQAEHALPGTAPLCFKLCTGAEGGARELSAQTGLEGRGRGGELPAVLVNLSQAR